MIRGNLTVTAFAADGTHLYENVSLWTARALLMMLTHPEATGELIETYAMLGINVPNGGASTVSVKRPGGELVAGALLQEDGSVVVALSPWFERGTEK